MLLTLVEKLWSWLQRQDAVLINKTKTLEMQECKKQAWTLPAEESAETDTQAISIIYKTIISRMV